MTNQPKIVALVPLKGESRSIPRKNIKPLAGKPLCYWTCSAATNSKYVNQVYVSTEDEEIKKIVDSFGLGIKFIPEKLVMEKDVSVIESVIMNFMNYVNDFDVLITLQSTSAFTTLLDIDKAVEKFIKNGYDSMLTGVLMKRFYWTKDGKPLNYDYKKRPLRQVFEGTIMENGSFYITKKEILKKDKCRLGGKIGIYEMPKHTAIEIDEPSDWEDVERIFKKRKNETSI